MTNIHDCIQRAVDAKELAPRQGRAAQGAFDQLVTRYEQIMPRHQAEASAAADLKEATRRAARSRYHAVINQLQAMRRIKQLIETHPDPARAIRGLIEGELHIKGGENVRFLTDAYVQSINAGLRDVIAQLHPNLIGSSRDRSLLLDMIDEMHGDATGNAHARALAEAVRGQQRRMRQMFNAHGGDIGEIADYGVAHSHDPIRLMQAGYEDWRAALEKLGAWDRIIDKSTGRPFASAKGVIPPRADTEGFLRSMWESITTRGWADRDPSLSPGGTALYNQRAHPREFHFASGKDWRSYNDRFGRSDAYSALLQGLHGMARDVSLMRVLGPNPKAGLNYAIQVAQQRVAGNARAAARVDLHAKRALADLAMLDGSGSIPESAALAAFGSGVRTVLAATQLGSAVLSSFSDPVTSAAAALSIGMNPGNVMSRGVQLLASASTRETAGRLGYIGQSLAEAGAGASRALGGEMLSGLPERMSTFVMKASLLNLLTDFRRIAFQMEFSAYLAELAGSDFGGLPELTRRMLENRGITAGDWDQLRDPAARFRSPTGEDFISADHWLEHQTSLPRVEAVGLAMRLRMVLAERVEMAIPTGRIAVRGRLLQGPAPGSAMGELLRSSASYKNFAFSLMFGQYQQFMSLRNNWTRASYAAAVLTGLTLAGALTIQLKELAKGNDPRPMTNGVFWKAAILQGGGFGIFGDFFAASESRAGGGIAQTLAGPMVGLAADIATPIVSNASRALAGEPTTIGRDASKFIRRNTPVLSSLWWERAAFDRIVADNLQSFLDPDARRQWQQEVRKRARDYGNRPFIGRGAASLRAPDLSNIGATR